MNGIKNIRHLWFTVVAVAMGYAVDLYNLLLFGTVRKASLSEMGITGDAAFDQTILLMNITVVGMLLGGFFWGALSDRYGRAKLLYISIIAYIVFNLLNAFVTNIISYQLCRFAAGFALAGELGTGITLVSEILPKEKRSKAIAIITACGMLGAVLAGVLSYFLEGKLILGFSSWRFLFVFGAILGLVVFIFRVKIIESSVFTKTAKPKVFENLKYLFSEKKRIKKFFYSFLIGAPVFFIIGIYVTMASDFGKLQGHTDVKPSLAILWCYLAIAISDFVGTLISKYFKTRKRIIFYYLLIQAASILIYLYLPVSSTYLFYGKVILLGVSIGLWGLIVVFAAENWGTNLRGTITTVVPNIIRFLLMPITYLLFKPLRVYFPLEQTSLIISVILLAIAFYSLSRFEDRFENDVDFLE